MFLLLAAVDRVGEGAQGGHDRRKNRPEAENLQAFCKLSGFVG